jgi:predicted nucleotidyltransferase
MTNATSRDYTDEAAAAIALCKRWADELMKAHPCEVYLFGSAIYEQGEQFDARLSDLDLVVQYHELLDATRRAERLFDLRERQQRLELWMIPALGRSVCDEPGVSIVPVVPVEIEANIHKSHARSFFDRNIFYDLRKEDVLYGLPGAARIAFPENARHALEFAQAVRNGFLSVSANGTGGLVPFDGSDPIPKALARAAAQLVPDPGLGAWYDTRFGLEFLFGALTRRRNESDALSELYRKISVRRGGRGVRRTLDAKDQLLLTEILFDLAVSVERDEIASWEVRFGGAVPRRAERERLVQALRRLVPDAHILGVFPGSVIIRLMSSATSLATFRSLEELGALPRFFGVESVEISEISLDDGRGGFEQHDLAARIAARIAEWRPDGGENEAVLEAKFAGWLEQTLGEDGALAPAGVDREMALHVGRRRYWADIVLRYGDGDAGQLIAVEITRLRNPGDMIRQIEKLRRLLIPTILVVVGSEHHIFQMGDVMRQIVAAEPGLHIVPIVEPPETAEGG